MDPQEACRLLGVEVPRVVGMSRPEQERVLQEWKDGPLKKAWKKRSRECHPDQPGGSDKAFADLSNAYRMLSETTIGARPASEPEPAYTGPPGSRIFQFGPLTVTLSTEDEAMLARMSASMEQRIAKQVKKTENRFRGFVEQSFEDMLDGVLFPAPKRRPKRRPAAAPRRPRTTVIG